MVYPDIIPKPIVSTAAKYVGVEVDVASQFTNGQEFDAHNHIL